MSDPTEYQEEGRSQKPAFGLGYYGHLDPEPPLVLTYLAVFSILAGVGFVAWLGWGWQAIVLTALVAALGVGALVFRRRRQGSDPSATHYDDPSPANKN
ncbi:MAG: NfeD family protein [Actinomycetota bacterium]